MRFTFALNTAASTLAIGVAAIAAPAFAQSTGSQDFEKEIVVTGTRGTTQNVEGVASPDTPKAKAVLTSEAIQRAAPGQTVLDTINQIPGVSFQNNDAYGSSGGTLNIRGFDSTRISLTFDGVPLNDSGNYAIFSNQQIDPELIEQVNVNLGTTDVDSPTASAVGGTVNLRTRNPSKDFGLLASMSLGEWDFWRVFGMVDTGELTSSGTRAWFSASTAKNHVPYNGFGKIDKQQFNFKLYQPLGGDDFISIGGHYNQNRNNFFGSLPLRIDTTATPTSTTPRVVGSGNGNRFPILKDERFYSINQPCQLDTPQAGVGDTPAPAPTNLASCGTEFDRRYNPSNTGNIRVNSKFTLSDSVVLTIDPSYQYVKANGGGTVTASEGLRDIDPTGGTTPAFGAVSCATATPVTATCRSGYFGGTPFFGKDINGDGDTLDTVTVLAPSQTQTHRIGVIAGLRWNLDDNNSVRIAYTYDRARHRQTGEVGLLEQLSGEPLDVFPVNSGSAAASGSILQKRDRLSYAILQQVSGEYTGKFGDLTVNLGVRAPFFRRNLTNYCFTSSAGGFVECSGQNAGIDTTLQTLNPYTFNTTTNAVTGWAVPQQRVFNYNKVLPNVGLTYKIGGGNASVFFSYSKGLSVPGTDSLYNAFYFPLGTPQATPAPETTDNFDLGMRFRSSKVQGSVSVFYNQFQNRLATAYDPELDQNVYRNLGNVKKYGIDGYLSVRPVDAFSFYVSASWLRSEIRDNIEVAKNQNGVSIFAPTAGKAESGSPTYTVSVGARGHAGPFTLGVNAKRTGPRWIYDTNLPTYTGFYVPAGALTSTNTFPVLSAVQNANTKEVYGAQAPAYWMVGLDARLKLESIGFPEGSYLQFNVYNLFDQFYVGGFGGGLIQANTFSRTTGIASYGNPNFVQIGAPRTASATLVLKF
jgi:iron complex outermembrane recepter protein